jgi:quinol-cytochrome oxidoreductase complex cytochrome b subunit
MNKELIFKGLSRLFIAILFAFTGPVIYTSAVRNEDHPFFIPVLVLGLIACILAILYGFRGIKLLVKGFFNEN